MGWDIGYDENWRRDIGYGVPSLCDHQGCDQEIHRGLGYVCGGDPYGGDAGCGLFFCSIHLHYSDLEDEPQLCACCMAGQDPSGPTPDTKEWLTHKLTHKSWKLWRKENLYQVAAIKKRLGVPHNHIVILVVGFCTVVLVILFLRFSGVIN